MSSQCPFHSLQYTLSHEGHAKNQLQSCRSLLSSTHGFSITIQLQLWTHRALSWVRWEVAAHLSWAAAHYAPAREAGTADTCQLHKARAVPGELPGIPAPSRHPRTEDSLLPKVVDTAAVEDQLRRDCGRRLESATGVILRRWHHQRGLTYTLVLAPGNLPVSAVFGEGQDVALVFYTGYTVDVFVLRSKYLVFCICGRDALFCMLWSVVP